MEKNQFPNLYHQIVDVIKPSTAFLVGGAVRDLLLGKSIQDLDFVVPSKTIATAKRVADQLNGDYYLLDKQRHAGRVLLQDEGAQRFVVDFTTLQGRSIEEDLGTRDFTITSMAINITEQDQIIDPFCGAKDLTDGLIRSTTLHSIQDDPVRCLRAVRMAVQFGFKILPETKDQIRGIKGILTSTSFERIRDELFKILTGPDQHTAFQILQILDIYPQIFEEPFSTKQGNALRWLEILYGVLSKEHNQDVAANWVLGQLVHRLGRFRSNLQSYLGEELIPGRTRYQLSFLPHLLFPTRLNADSSDSGQPSSPFINQKLQLSNREFKFIQNADRAMQTCISLNKEPSPLFVYRFFRDYDDAGVAGVFLMLAYFLGNNEKPVIESSWQKQLDLARILIEGWCEKRELWIDPPGLLNGDELCAIFGLEPGPEIGSLLEELREAQVRDGLHSKEDAQEFISNMIDSTSNSEN